VYLPIPTVYFLLEPALLLSRLALDDVHALRNLATHFGHDLHAAFNVIFDFGEHHPNKADTTAHMLVQTVKAWR
jgi:hypothetical protein